MHSDLFDDDIDNDVMSDMASFDKDDVIADSTGDQPTGQQWKSAPSVVSG